ncbi:unnamed protein product [Caenorhabditis auriculariae]|uniref:Nudix hydrolase domain-containing protein n=1 Tax=Caenorhabditis auriculariae TaxID=2777116 RepID=A0A8S1H5U9_9PELO|nr:unnamed protein product [Caenorhabditis auriculariae]
MAVEVKCPYKLYDEVVLFNGKWMQARQIRFRTADGTEGVWQSAHRNTRPAGASADGVSIIGVLRRADKKFIVLVKQYRIPLGKFCLEFPAAEQAALRELKEETGYTASRVISTSESCGLDPGLTDDSVNLVMVEIDGDAPENVNPSQKLDSTESIDVILLEHDQLLNYVRNAGKDVVVEACLYAYAMGTQFAQMA